MTGWLQRNTVPIMLVLAASAVVIAGFEFLDYLSSSERLEPSDGDAGINVGGLIKVTIFLAVPASITLAIRKR